MLFLKSLNDIIPYMTFFIFFTFILSFYQAFLFFVVYGEFNLIIIHLGIIFSKFMLINSIKIKNW